MNIKCITFDKQAQDALPEEIKAKMRADRGKAIMDRQLKKMEALNKNKNKMERTIEFRVWNGMEMVYDVMVGKFGIFYVNPANNGIDENDSARLTPVNTKYPDDIPLMQYTGMKDKYGKKVYEGDIVRFCDDPPYCSDYTIKYDDERMIWIADGVGDFMEDLWELGEDYVEVIGNIYDKAQQKQALIDTMRGDEELGLYDDNPQKSRI